MSSLVSALSLSLSFSCLDHLHRFLKKRFVLIVEKKANEVASEHG